MIAGQEVSLLGSEVQLPGPAPTDYAIVVVVPMVIANMSVSGSLLLLVGGLGCSVLATAVASGGWPSRWGDGL